MRILMSVGEPSGDELGAEVMKSYISHGICCEFMGVGGPNMRALDFKSLLLMEDIAVSGFAAVLPKIPRLLKLKKQFFDLLQTRPDLLILVDYPGFNLKLIQKAHEVKVPVIYIAPPQVWFWKKRRLQYLQNVKVCTLFEFELNFLKLNGINAACFQHPLIAKIPVQSALTESKILLLPGSRMHQVQRNLPRMLQMVQRIKEQNPEWKSLEVCVSVPHIQMKRYLDQYNQYDQKFVIIENIINCVDLNFLFALSVVGTSNLYLYQKNIPFVIFHSVSLFTYWVGKIVFKGKKLCLVNHLIESEPVSEFFYVHKLPDVSMVVNNLNSNYDSLPKLPQNAEWQKDFYEWSLEKGLLK